MAKCSIIGCTSDPRKNDEGLSFFRFPKKPAIRKLWMDAIGHETLKSVGIIKICSKHFKDNCLNRTLSVVRLKDDAIPTLLLPKSKLSKKNCKTQSRTDLTEAESARNSSSDEELDSPESRPVQPALTSPCRAESARNSSSDEELDSPESRPVQPALTRRVKSSVTVLTTNSDIDSEDSQPSTQTIEYLHPDKDFGVEEVIKMEKMKMRLVKQRRKIRTLHQKCRRLTQKLLIYKNIVDDFKKQNGVPQKSVVINNIIKVVRVTQKIDK